MVLESYITEIIKSEMLVLKQSLKKELQIQYEPYLKRKEAATYLGCCVSTIDNFVRDGTLEKFKVGRSSKFKRSDLDRLLR
jgi:excisionase family DNA binding protein